MRALLNVLVVCAGLAALPRAARGEYIATFVGGTDNFGSVGAVAVTWMNTPGADGANGWVQTFHPSGGTQLGTPIPGGGAQNLNFLGDLAAQHGEGLDQIKLSFDFKTTDAATSASGPRVRFVPDGWMKNYPVPGALANTWYHIEDVIDTTWDNATANANGWTGAGSWAATMSNVTDFMLIQGPVSTENAAWGHDNIAWSAIPEPASLALVGVGALLMMRRRRA